MTPGQAAYEEDCRRAPGYHDGRGRKAWSDLDDAVKDNWERNPTPREWVISMRLHPIETAKKDGTPILAKIKDNLNRDDLERWQGLYVVIRHPGLGDNGFDVGWNMAAPVGHGGFPDEWFDGWMTLPSTNES